MFAYRWPAVLLLLFLVGVVGRPLLAADELQPVKVFAVTGSQAGNTVEYVAERKEKPTVYLFVNAATWDRPIARYLKVLDTKIGDGIKGADDARVVAVWLTDDVGKAKEYLPKAQQSLNMARTDWTVFEGSKEGPTGWKIDTTDHLTAVVVRGGKEVARFAYKSTNDTDVPDVINTLKK